MITAYGLRKRKQAHSITVTARAVRRKIGIRSKGHQVLFRGGGGGHSLGNECFYRLSTPPPHPLYLTIHVKIGGTLTFHCGIFCYLVMIIETCASTHLHVYAHIRTCTCTCAYIHMHTHIYIVHHMYTHATCTQCMNVQIHTCMHSRTHSRLLVVPPSLAPLLRPCSTARPAKM